VSTYNLLSMEEVNLPLESPPATIAKILTTADAPPKPGGHRVTVRRLPLIVIRR
jgi:hypothetical protein